MRYAKLCDVLDIIVIGIVTVICDFHFRCTVTSFSSKKFRLFFVYRFIYLCVVIKRKKTVEKIAPIKQILIK